MAKYRTALGWPVKLFPLLAALAACGAAPCTGSSIAAPVPAVVMLLAGCAAASPGGESAYDSMVLASRPVLYLTMSGALSGSETDRSGHGHDGGYHPSGDLPAVVAMPNSDLAADFNGNGQYLQVSDAAALSIPTTGVLTLEAWIRPDTLQFTHQEGSGYVYWMGKGRAHAQEYALRMYSRDNTETPPRPNRISGYAFNSDGGLGSGAYFQDEPATGQWIMVDLIIDTVSTSAAYPTGYVAIYKDGALRQTQALNQFNVRPERGEAPFDVATRNGASFLSGAIGKVAVYDVASTPDQIQQRYEAMIRKAPPTP